MSGRGFTARLLTLLGGGRRKQILRELFARRLHAEGAAWGAGMEQMALQGRSLAGSPEAILLQVVEGVRHGEARGLSTAEAIAAEEARRRRRGADDAAFAAVGTDLSAYVGYRLRLEHPRAESYRDAAFTAGSVALAREALSEG